MINAATLGGHDGRGIDLPSLGAARGEAIKRIWAILNGEQGQPLRPGRRMTISDKNGAVLMVVTFDEALAAAGTG